MTSGAIVPEKKPIKLALCGDSGVGKTGAAVSLILAGYKLRTIDVDNGVDIILNCLHSPDSPYHSIAKTLDLEKAFRYETVNHKMITMDVGHNKIRIQPQSATVWPKIEQLAHEWKEACGYNLGPITSWGDDTVLMLDSSSLAGYAAFFYSQQINNRLGADPSGNTWRRDIGTAQDYFENLLRMLYSDAIKCNILVITHINYLNESYQESDSGVRTRVVSSNASDVFGVTRAYPSVVGRALGPRFGRYFNNVLEMRLEGKRGKIHTVGQGAVNVRTTAPFSLKPSYDVATGLAEIFAVLRGQPEPRELLAAVAKPIITPRISTVKPMAPQHAKASIA